MMQSAFSREIKCPVHHYIPVSALLARFLDTRHFQRLRYIKQLGTSYYVWAGASHNRFEHCLGVAFLARKMVTHLRDTQPELCITERDIQCVEIAGLCHDLGHGPFSHVYDGAFIPRALPNTTWEHEDASEMMLDDLVETYEINIPAKDVAFIKDLIRGYQKHTLDHSPPEKKFLFEIVANKRNGIDVDKFDYIARDTHAIGESKNDDALRLLTRCRVIDDEICFPMKDYTTVYELFRTRFKLHKKIYSHKAAKAIEYMVVDAMLAADPYLKLSESILDPKKFLKLTDAVLEFIEYSENEELAAARSIIDRLRRRDLYKFVDLKVLPWHYKTFWATEVTSGRIMDAARELRANLVDREPDGDDDTLVVKELFDALKEEDIIVDWTTVHYGMKEKNPLDNVKFYGKHNINQSFRARPDDVSHLVPLQFGEVSLRVFTRDSRYMGVIQAAFRSVLSSLPTVSFSAADHLESGADDEDQSVATEPVTPRMVTPPLVADTPGPYDTPKLSGSNSLVSVPDKSTPPGPDIGPVEPTSPALLGPIILVSTPSPVSHRRSQARQRSSTPLGPDRVTNDHPVNPSTPLGKTISPSGSLVLDGATPPSKQKSFSVGRPLDPNPFTTLPSSPSAGKRRQRDPDDGNGDILLQLLGIGGGRDGRPVRKKRG